MKWLGLVLALVAAATLVPAAEAQYSDDNNEIYSEEEEEDVDVDVPEFISTPKNFTVEPGKKVILPCQVNNMNVPLMWSRANPETGSWVILALNDHLQVPPEDQERYRLRKLDGDGGMVLTVDELTEADAGRYKCDIMSQPVKSIAFYVRVGYFPDETTTTTERAAEVSDSGAAAGAAATTSAAAAAAALLLALR